MRGFWPNKISNASLLQATRQVAMRTILQRRWKWLGHVLRMEPTARTALTWTPEGWRNRGRKRKTWRRTVLEEMKSVTIGLGSAARLAQDRTIWRNLVEALCATGHNEDER